MNILELLALPPPPPPGPLIPTGTEIILAGALVLLLGRRSRRSAVAFVLVAAMYYVLIPEDSPLQRWLTERIAGAFAWGPALLLGASGTPATVEGDALVTADLVWPVLRGCLGLSYLALFVMAVLCAPGGARRKLAWLAAGTGIHLALNAARVAVLYGFWYDCSFVAYELLHAGGGLYFGLVLAAVFMAFRHRPVARDCSPRAAVA